jgi:hypothetical protein
VGLNGLQGVQGWQGTAGTTFNPISGPFYQDATIYPITDGEGNPQVNSGAGFIPGFGYGSASESSTVIISGYQLTAGQSYVASVLSAYPIYDGGLGQWMLIIYVRGVAGYIDSSATFRVYYYVLS